MASDHLGRLIRSWVEMRCAEAEGLIALCALRSTD